MSHTNQSKHRFYDEEFYSHQYKDAFLSAKEYARIYSEHYSCNSIIDVGCGRGAWLTAFRQIAGAKILVGLDGGWNRGKLMDENITFIPHDLDNLVLSRYKLDACKYDLAISVEVAEHIKPTDSERFVAELTKLSDHIIFSAAYLGQPGTNHINLKKHSKWAQMFANHGYAPLDLFREHVYGLHTVKWWYQANVFLYVAESVGHKPSLVANLDWMDSVHPILYEELQNRSFLKSFRQTCELLPKAIKRNLSKPL